VSAADEPLGVLVVGWFPGADDPIAGRFVADQAAALLATGRVRPSVVSFEPFPLQGDLALREQAATAWADVVRGAGPGLALAPRGVGGPPGIPVARLGTSLGGTRGASHTNAAIHRATALRALLDGGSVGSPSLVHAHVGYPEGAAAAVVATELGLPLVLTEHATYLDRLFADPEIRAAYLAGARAASRIIAVGGVLAERIVREFPELRDRVVVIPNTVDVEAFRPVGPAGRDADELLWVGYRREVKGTAALLRAFRIVREARPAMRLRLIGRSTTDAEEAGWRGLAAELGISEAVAFEPPADRDTVAGAMERAALFVHPSRAETMGIVAVEALAAGLPVVAVDSGGVTEVLGPAPDSVGALVPDQAPEPLAAAILATLDRRLAFDPVRLREHVVARYGAAVVAGRIADLYDEVLAAPPAAERSRRITRAEAGARPASDHPVMIIGFERAILNAKLAAFPGDSLGDFVIATSGDAVPGHPGAVRIDSQRTADLEAFLSLSGRARGPGPAGILLAAPRWIGRWWLRRRLAGHVLPALGAAVALAADRAAMAGGDPPIAVCLGGVDVLAVERLRAAGRVIVAPGGLRWLSDLRAETSPPGRDRRGQAVAASSP
jgi:glycosyltransferase involved in cell wall biosynthesis